MRHLSSIHESIQHSLKSYAFWGLQFFHLCFVSFPSHNFKNIRVATTEHFSCFHLWCEKIILVHRDFDFLLKASGWFYYAVHCACDLSESSWWWALPRYWTGLLIILYFRKLEKLDSWNNCHKPQPHHGDIGVAVAVQSIFTSHLSPFHKSFLFEGICGWSSFVQFL